MGNKIYQVCTNMTLHIQEVEYVKKTESSYWIKGDSQSRRLDSLYAKSFDTKEEAIDYLESLLQSQLISIKSTLDYYNEQVEKFNKLYKQHEK
jgi:hypothetical protein